MAIINILTSSLVKHENVLGANYFWVLHVGYPQLSDNTDPDYVIFLMSINIERYIFHAAENLISLQGQTVQTIYSQVG